MGTAEACKSLNRIPRWALVLVATAAGTVGLMVSSFWIGDMNGRMRNVELDVKALRTTQDNNIKKLDQIEGKIDRMMYEGLNIRPKL